MNRMTENCYKTMENVERYVLRTGSKLYKKLAGSSEGAFWKRKDYTLNLRLTDMTVRGPIDWALFQAHLNIPLVKKEYYNAVAAYLEECVHPDLGSMQVDEHGDVYCKVELPICDQPISEETLAALEAHWAELIEMHRSNIVAIATYGYMTEFRSPQCADEAVEVCSQDNRAVIERNAESIREHLIKHSRHNAVSESVDEMGYPCWANEIYMGDDHYMLEISISPDGFATFKMMYGVGAAVQKACRPRAAAFLMKESSDRKVGYLYVGDDEEPMGCMTTTCLLDGPISTDTFEHIEAMLIKSLLAIREEFELIAHGMTPAETAEKADEPNPAELFRAMRALERMRAKGSDDDDDDDDDDDIDISALLDGIFSSRGGIRDQGDNESGDADDSEE